ncbi:MAG: DUF1800 domain-containing protein [Saprospiraceae bacterium]|nr:DUF1800 domain-containing protein [Candidatus Vicinibacter proximus]
MDRRKLFSILTSTAEVEPMRPTTALPVNGGLTPYQGIWDYATAAHLLRRAMFGPTHEQIKEAVSDGLQKTLDKLAKDQALPSPPVLYTDQIADPDIPKGQTWVTGKLNPQVQGLVQLKENSLYSWLMQLMFNEGVSLTEKMTLFWHNHFVVSEIFDPRYNYDYITTLRSNCMGNFKSLTEKITIDKSMLIYLNGNQNTNLAPNENFAREVMELFTLGKGALAGPGDYTTFTEQDVLAVAKALTGWTIAADRRNESFYPYARFDTRLHDKSTKQLSARFNNQQITNGEENEYKTVINLIFQKREAATFICRKLYNYFVYYKVDQTIESQIIDEMANLLIANNFEIKPVLKALLGSEHFYSIEALGCMIRPPYEFIFNTLKAMKFKPSADLEINYSLFVSIYRNNMGLQQVYFDIPSVAGWSPYYQEPGYHEIWINSVTYPLRVGFTGQAVNKQMRIRGGAGTTTFGLDLVEYVTSFTDPANISMLLSEIVAHLLPQNIYQNQIDFLKKALLGNLTEAQWATMWNNYKANPNNAQARTAVDSRLKPLFTTLLSMPEYFLS